MSYTFTYLDPNDVEVSMNVPERSIDEMCEYFQRFLSACGYVFDEGENIKSVKDDRDYPGCGGDILTFNGDGTPFGYDFGAAQPVTSSLFWRDAEDLINLD